MGRKMLAGGGQTSQSHFSRLEQILDGFTNLYSARRKFVSSKADSNSEARKIQLLFLA